MRADVYSLLPALSARASITSADVSSTSAIDAFSA